MAMVDDSTEHEKVTVKCKNCERFISFFFKPKGQPLIGNWFCNLICIDKYETRQRKIKEGITKKTLNV